MAEIIFIVGPTATGKSDIAFSLAKKICADIVACDSMTVYKEADIITSKPAAGILAHVPHHFINIISVTEEYSVFDYYEKAFALLQSLHARNKPAIVCGGSGLYVKALLDGIFEGVGKDEKIRAMLTERVKFQGNGALHDELARVDAASAKRIAVNDTKRIVRALEVYYSSGKTMSERRKSAKGLYEKLPMKIFGLTCPRQFLYERINKRVDRMVDQGAIEEVEALLRFPLSQTARKIIGIKEIGGYLKGEYDIEKAKESMKLNTRHFAKRQVTWFKPDARIKWFDVQDKRCEEVVDVIVSNIP